MACQKCGFAGEIDGNFCMACLAEMKNVMAIEKPSWQCDRCMTKYALEDNVSECPKCGPREQPNRNRAEWDEAIRRNEQQRADELNTEILDALADIYNEVVRGIVEQKRPRKWEYREETNMPVAELNKLGADGWELIAVHVVVLPPDKVETFYAFKRQL